MKNCLSTIFFTIIILGCSCDSTEPENDKLFLNIKDVQSTEIWLQIRTNDIPLPTSLNVNLNSILTRQIELISKDTLFYIDSLKPTSSYFVQAETEDEKSRAINVETLDTTSHSFSWEYFEFGGQIQSSSFYDVAIINENNIWVVGGVYLTDSSGQLDSDAYNAAHWDGTEWKLKRIMFYTICGQQDRSSYPTKSILAFSESEIWIALDGTQIAKLDEHGKAKIMCTNLPFSISKIWGGNPNSVFAVGTRGGIAHYNGTSWQSLESETEMWLSEIHAENENNIYISGSDSPNIEGLLLGGNKNGIKIIKRGYSLSAQQIFKPHFAGSATTVFVVNHTVYFGGNLLYRYKLNNLDYVNSLKGNYIGGNRYGQHWGFLTMIRGIDETDMVLVGEKNTIRHYNGST
jgi:hypothetical protein